VKIEWVLADGRLAIGPDQTLTPGGRAKPHMCNVASRTAKRTAKPNSSRMCLIRVRPTKVAASI